MVCCSAGRIISELKDPAGREQELEVLFSLWHKMTSALGVSCADALRLPARDISPCQFGP